MIKIIDVTKWDEKYNSEELAKEVREIVKPTLAQLKYIATIERYAPHEFTGTSRLDAGNYISGNKKYIPVIDYPLYEHCSGDSYNSEDDMFYNECDNFMGPGIHCADDMLSNCW